MEEKELLKIAEDFGFEHFGMLDPRTLEFRQDIRDMCNPDACPNFGKRWSCPPAVPDIEELSKKCEGYTRGIIVQTVGKLEDSFDFEAMVETEKLHKKRFDEMTIELGGKVKDLWPMSAGACMICKECTYPDEPCRFPERRFTSMEAFGLYVSKVCVDNGLAYNYGPNALAYTSCWIFN